jgi:hypothetical protein
MTRRISDLLYDVSGRWVTLGALVVFVLFMALVLPGQAAEAESSAAGAGSPDTSVYYSPSDLYRMAEAYGPQGRLAYLRARWTFDLAFPLVYSAFLVTAISWLWSRAVSLDSPWRRANVVPLLAALFDYLENSATSVVMARYPAQTPVVASLAPVFTLIKWALIMASFVLLVAAAFAAFWTMVGSRSSE